MTALHKNAQPRGKGGDRGGEEGDFNAGHESVAADGKFNLGDLVALERDDAGLRPAETRPAADPNDESGSQDDECE